jgi:hypothetical protein
MSTDAPITARQRLDSWKEIADYLGRDVRTAMRWEQDGLPVHRVPGGLRRGVFAIPDEVDAWLADRNHEVPESTVEAPSTVSVPVSTRRFSQDYFWVAGVVVVVFALVLVAIRSFHAQRDDEISFSLPGEKFEFVASNTIPLGGPVGAMVTADLNRDGLPDLVVGGVPTRRFVVLLNRAGGFDRPVYYAACDSSVGPAVADFDGDGNLDIALTCHNSREVQVWWGDGKGGFGSPVNMESGIEPVRSDAGDFNRDGIGDFVTDASGGGSLSVYIGHANRTFTRTSYDAGSNPHVPFVADFDGDGILDIVVACSGASCRTLSLLHGNGDGSFTPAGTLPTIGNAWSAIAADLTGDNIPDIYSSAINGEESLFVGIGRARFLPAKLALRAASADVSSLFTAHGRNYILDTQLYPAVLRLLSFDAQGNVATSNSVPLHDDPRFAVAGDYNRDGRDDIAVLFMKGDASYVTVYHQK